MSVNLLDQMQPNIKERKFIVTVRSKLYNEITSSGGGSICLRIKPGTSLLWGNSVNL